MKVKINIECMNNDHLSDILNILRSLRHVKVLDGVRIIE